MRGGKRPGAGRKKGARKWNGYKVDPTAPVTVGKYASAEEYLAAVVEGTEPPDRDRIAAAKAMMPYQRPKVRLPHSSSAPKQMEREQSRDAERQQREDWAEKSKAVRLKLVKGAK